MVPNKRENMNPMVQKIDNIVMSESEKLLKDLDIEAMDLAGLIDVIRDRMLQSTDASFPISLAKLGELKLQALKQKNEVLKNLTNYKSAENNSTRKGPGELSISDLLNSAALGAGMGAKLSMSGQPTQQPRLIDDAGETNLIDVQIETRQQELPSVESVADSVIRDLEKHG
jgi:hypothetical protein